MIRFACPGCGATYSVPDDKAGKNGKCPKCQGQFVIPAAEPAAVAAAPPPADAGESVEVAPCPGCQARLSVSASDLGADIECPYCKVVYKAQRGRASAPAAAAPAAAPPAAAEPEPEDDFASMGAPAAVEDDQPRRRRGRGDEDEKSEERPSRWKRGGAKDKDKSKDREEAPSAPPAEEPADEDFVRPSSRRSTRQSKPTRPAGPVTTVRKVSVMSAAKMTAGLYGLFGLVFGALAALSGAVALILSFAMKDMSFLMYPAFGMCGSVILLPVMLGLQGFIAGAIGALIYNIVAKKMGGFQVELELPPATPKPE